MEKQFYYPFKKFDICFFCWLIEFLFILYTKIYSPFILFLFFITGALWGYKTLVKHVAVEITDEYVKIDKSEPLYFKNIKSAEIKEVRLCGKNKKILSLTPKKNIKYNYSYLQLNNCDFGPFPIPLYGILTKEDEKEIVELISKKVKMKSWFIS